MLASQVLKSPNATIFFPDIPLAVLAEHRLTALLDCLKRIVAFRPF
jgi:hypothetical protein